MTVTPVGMRCPECAKQKTKVRVGPGAFTATDVPVATYALIAINVIVFLAEIAKAKGGVIDVIPNSLVTNGGLFGPAVANGDYWRIITSGFLHAGLIHIALNMYILYIAGGLLERSIGSLRFVALYFLSLLAGSFIALLLDPNALTVGASGAIFGLMAAAVIIAYGRGREDVARQFGILVALNLFLSFSVSNISIGAHLGGLIGGAIASLFVIYIERRRGPALPLEIPVLTVIAAAFAIAAVVAANSA
jgi:membrane associated rhomboid family serine protease